MGKVIKLTESDLERIVKQVLEEQETQEGIGDVYHGVRGFFKGKGYDYFKYLSTLRGLSRQLKKADEPNLRIMGELKTLEGQVRSSNMEQRKKNDLIRSINGAINDFESYSRNIGRVEQLASQRLK